MTRKLATIQRIKELNAIPGADRIELAVINGWQVVTQKGQHKVGDLVVFYEIDSFLSADDPRYASFEDRFINWNGKRGMRLKTIRLKKQLSQGLIMPVRSFPELFQYYVAPGVDPSTMKDAEGADVTEILKIEKWEQVEKENTSSMASPTRSFPFFLRKTDQERIQNYGPLVLKALDEEFEVTMKKDGSSMTVFRVDPKSPHYAGAKMMAGVKQSLWQRIKAFVLRTPDQPIFGICSRNVLLSLEGDSNFHKAAGPVLTALKDSGMAGVSLAFQGEVVAPSIQDNYEKVSGVEFHLFDAYDIDKQEYLLPQGRQNYAKFFHISHATVVAKGKLRDILGYKEGDDVVKLALAYASGPGDNPGVAREGVVFKAMGRDFSFKAVSDEYLLKTGK